MTCDKCEECRADKNKFCKYCGASLTSKYEHLFFAFFILGLITAFACTLVLILEYGVALWGFDNVFPQLSTYTDSLIIVTPFIVSVCNISGVTLQIFYILLLIAVSASLFTLFHKAAKPVASLLKKDFEPIKKTALFEMTVLFAASYIIQIVFVMILSAMGVDLGSLPERETWRWMYDLLYASVWEEVITRILYIGVPMIVVYAITKKNELPLWRYLFGGFEINRIVLVFIIFSAFMFGAAHLNSWNSWKFFTTFLFGIITGYLFVKYGVYATIAMHFLTDYLQAEQWLTGNTVTFSVMIVLLVSVICLPYVYIYAKRCVDYLKKEFLSEKGSE